MKKLFLSAVLLSPLALMAQSEVGGDAQKALNIIAGNAGIKGDSDAYAVAGRIINFVLGIIGVVFLFVIIYGGYRWMMAGGIPSARWSPSVR